jgi:hypothetical protein
MELAIIQSALIFDPLPPCIIANLELDGKRYRSKIIGSARKLTSIPPAGNLWFRIHEQLRRKLTSHKHVVQRLTTSSRSLETWSGSSDHSLCPLWLCQMETLMFCSLTRSYGLVHVCRDKEGWRYVPNDVADVSNKTENCIWTRFSIRRGCAN